MALWSIGSAQAGAESIAKSVHIPTREYFRDTDRVAGGAPCRGGAPALGAAASSPQADSAPFAKNVINDGDCRNGALLQVNP